MKDPRQQSIELAKEAVKQLFAPVQDLMQRLLGPAETEVGLSFADSARVWRFKQAIRLFEEVNKLADAAHIELKPVAPNLIFPILDAASLKEGANVGMAAAIEKYEFLRGKTHVRCDVRQHLSFPEA